MATKDRLWKIRGARATRPPRSFEIARDRVGLSPMHPDMLCLTLEEELDRNAIIVSENLTGAKQFFSTGFREDEKSFIETMGGCLG